MIQILEAQVTLANPIGHHRHCLVAQIPNALERSEIGYTVADPEQQWRTISSVLDLAARGEGTLRKMQFLVLPEGCVPFSRFDDLIGAVQGRLRCDTVTMFGLEHVRLSTYRGLLQRYREDNAEALALLEQDIESGSSLEMPANVCCTAIKESDGRLRVFLQAKGHPFRGEEFLDKFRDLYRGRHAYLFRCGPEAYNFMTLICLDYLYRDIYSSNIRQIVDHANQLFFSSRQCLDALFVIQCNPKPEHRAYRDVLTGFYGEFLEDTPGIRDTVTVFGNCSDESTVEGAGAPGGFGATSIVIGGQHKLARADLPEFSTDDFDGAPICRLRFGTSTRLYYFNLPLHHELDPRSSRIPLKVHAIMRRAPDDGWARITGDELVEGIGLGR
jgi:hypothetical protein